MALTDAQRKYLRSLGHDLKPVVLTGAAGLTPSVLAEIGGALDHHELVKVRLRGADRKEREAMIGRICAGTGAELVQRIGHVALLWRPNPERRRVSLLPASSSVAPAPPGTPRGSWRQTS